MLLTSALAVLSTTAVMGADTPVTPNASPEVRSLLAYFSSIYGKKILSGQQEGGRNFELRHIEITTGEQPALLGLDFSACTQQAPERDTQHRVTKSAIDWYQKRGGIVTFCWHWFAPTEARSFYVKDTTFDLARGVTEGTPEYEALLRDLDSVAGELKLLQEARVPVLWRPMHEVNGRWFWWGAAGPEPFKKLWRMMYDRYTHQHSLTNLIWVFSPGCSTDLADWYPGDDCVDMIGQDHYPMDGNDGAAKDVFDELVALGGGTKMVGMSENGPIPDPDKLVNERADWLFFTTWAGRILTERNPSNKLVKAFYHSHVLNLDDLPDLKNFPFKLAGKASKLAFTSPPGDVAVAGPRRLPVTVSVQDKHGRTVRTGTYTVTLELNRNPSKGELGGTLTASTVNGVATFPDLTLDKAGDGYTLKAKANGLRTGTSAPFRAGPGTGVLGEWWNDSKVEEFPELAQLTAPTRQAVLNKAFEMPVSSVTNYAARFRGFVIPPLTGKYEFWVANAAESELWLSTNSTPAARVKIAEVNPKTPYSKWPHINEAGSTPVRLEAGKRYYIELLQKQKGGSGQLAVRWRLPNGVEERPIPGFRFNPPDADASASQLPRTAN